MKNISKLSLIESNPRKYLNYSKRIAVFYSPSSLKKRSKVSQMPVYEVFDWDDDKPAVLVVVTIDSYFKKYFTFILSLESFSYQSESLCKPIEVDAIKAFMEKENSDGKTNWQYLCERWNERNPLKKIDFASTKQPNYSSIIQIPYKEI